MTSAHILVAGIGNVFLGDDAFGLEVVRQLAATVLPSDVEVREFGIRGVDLAYAMQQGEVLILVDAVRRGGEPGTLYTIEVDPHDLSQLTPVLGMHDIDPANAMRLATQLGSRPGRIYLIGCEAQATDEPGLSEPVARAVDRAIETVAVLIERIREDEPAHA